MNRPGISSRSTVGPIVGRRVAPPPVDQRRVRRAATEHPHLAPLLEEGRDRRRLSWRIHEAQRGGGLEELRRGAGVGGPGAVGVPNHELVLAEPRQRHDPADDAARPHGIGRQPVGAERIAVEDAARGERVVGIALPLEPAPGEEEGVELRSRGPGAAWWGDRGRVRPHLDLIGREARVVDEQDVALERRRDHGEVDDPETPEPVVVLGLDEEQVILAVREERPDQSPRCSGGWACSSDTSR